MKTIAFVTSSSDPHLIQDDRLAIEPLRKLGFDVLPLVWDDPSQDLALFDAFVFRSCWNYHRKAEFFENWLKDLKKLNRPVFNSIEINIWNLNKKYLLDLARKGVVIPETTFLPAGTFNSNLIPHYLQKIQSEKIVVKPSISLNGEDTYLLPKFEIEKIILRSLEINKSRDLLLQQFIPEIQTDGEISLMYFNKKFSHAIRKTAKQEEFRIHQEHGGSREAFFPESDVLSFAIDVVRAIPEDLLFCRVDLVRSSGKRYLIEFEILDPMLFLGMDLQAPDRFAKAIAEVL